MRAYRLAGGLHGVIEERPTGFGPTVFVGEVRDAEDRPISEHLNGQGNSHLILPVSVGPTEDAVLALLQTRATRLATNATAGIPAA